MDDLSDGARSISLAGEQSRQTSAGALSDLAVLRLRPVVLAAERLAAGVARELIFEHQSLVGRELTGEAANQRKVVAQQGHALDVQSSVWQVHPTLPRPSGSAEATAASIGLRPLRARRRS